MSKRILGLILIGVFALIGVALWIYRPPADAIPDDDASSDERLYRIGRAYEDATNRLGRPPREIDELRKSLKEQGHPPGNFVSPIDHQPYVIIWDIDVSTVPNNTVLAYERFGSAGKRYVLAVSGVKHLTDLELDGVIFPHGQPLP